MATGACCCSYRPPSWWPGGNGSATADPARLRARSGQHWRQIVSNRWLVVTGGMARSIFHVFIIGLVGRVASRVMVTQLYWANFLLFLIPSTIAVLAVCAILFLLFEKPFIYRDWPQTWRAAVLSRLAPRGVRG